MVKTMIESVMIRVRMVIFRRAAFRWLSDRRSLTQAGYKI